MQNKEMENLSRQAFYTKMATNLNNLHPQATCLKSVCSTGTFLTAKCWVYLVNSKAQ